MKSDDIKIIKAELQCLGVRIKTKERKQGGAGPAEGDTILLNYLTVATIPISSKFVTESPYSIITLDNKFILKKMGKEIMEISFLPTPQFYQFSDEDGIPYWKIALRHGRDCLASTVDQNCMYWGTKRQCRFCGIELSLKSEMTIPLKSGEQLSQVAQKACELDNLKHITLTTGTQVKSQNVIDHLCTCVKSIKERVNIPIHVQIEPADDSSRMEILKEAGADTIGIHIECFDMDILKMVAPAKAAHGLKKYKEYWRKAVDIFGFNQVSSFLIAGLNEKDNSIIEGCRYLSELGVYPYVIPLRPIPGSSMEKNCPPDHGMMIDIYEKAASILSKNELKAKDNRAGCVRCGACSAITDFECD